MASPLEKLASCAVAFVTILFPLRAGAATLKPETLSAWEQYVGVVKAQMREHLNPEVPFLWADEIPDRAAMLRSGEILVVPASSHIPKRVPSGLIHDWIGAAFVPNSSLPDVLPIIRDYGRYKDIYHPAVIDSRALIKSESEDRFSMLLMNRSIILRTALDSDYRSLYFRVNDQRLYSISETTRIQEIEGYGTGRQRALPEDEGTGLIWRTYSVTRLEERDGGVYIEVEAIVLSRDIPVSLRWMVSPIVRQVSRETLETSLRQTQDAVRSSAGLAARKAPEGTHCSNAMLCGAPTRGVSAFPSFH